MSEGFSRALAGCADPAVAWAKRDHLVRLACDSDDHQHLAAVAIHGGGIAGGHWAEALAWLEAQLQRLDLDPQGQRCLDRGCEVIHRVLGDRPPQFRRACSNDREALRLALASAQALAAVGKLGPALADFAAAVMLANDLPSADPLRGDLLALARELAQPDP